MRPIPLAMLVVAPITLISALRYWPPQEFVIRPERLEKSMPILPITNASPVLRTDFSDQPTWEAIRGEIQQPSAEGFEAHVEIIDDRAFEGISKEQLLAALPRDYPHTFMIVVDHRAISQSDHSLLVINLFDGDGPEVGEEFRTLPSEIQGIENNLSIANMGFEEFAGAVDADGVFRGF